MNIIHTSKRKAYNSDGVLSGLQCLLGSSLSLVDGLHNALVGPRCSHGVLGQVAHLLKQPATTSTFQVSALKHNHINVSGHCSQTACNHINVSSHCSQTQTHQHFGSLFSNTTISMFQVTALRHKHINILGHCSQTQPHQCFRSLLSNTNTSTFWVTVLKHKQINVSSHCSQTQTHQHFGSLFSNTTTSVFQVTALKHKHINILGLCPQTQPHQCFRSLLSNTTTSMFQVTALKHKTHQHFRSLLSNSLQPQQHFRSLLSDNLKGTQSKDTSWPENVDINVQRFPSAHFLRPFCRYVYNRSTIFASNLTISECSHACLFLNQQSAKSGL